MRLVQFKRDNQHYALKILKKSEVIYLKQVDHIKMEKTILEQIEHPFVVNMCARSIRGVQRAARP